MSKSNLVLTKTDFVEAEAVLSAVEDGFPITIGWPDGEVVYYNRAMLAYGLHTRSLLKECTDLGGIVVGDVEETD